MGTFIDDLAGGLTGLGDYNWLHHQSSNGVNYLVHRGDERTYHSIIKIIPAGDEKYHVVGSVYTGRFTKPQTMVYGYASNGPIGRLDMNRKVCGVFCSRIKRNVGHATKTA